jgi:hypothetical protein
VTSLAGRHGSVRSARGRAARGDWALGAEVGAGLRGRRSGGAPTFVPGGSAAGLTRLDARARRLAWARAGAVPDQFNTVWNSINPV